MYISAYEMKYMGGKISSSLNIIPFEDCYAKQYMQIYNACFYAMRKELGVRPYEFYQQENQLAQKQCDRYLYIQNGELIGSFVLEDNEIDDLIVNPRYQGCGYGTSLLHSAIALLQERQASSIILHVAAKNEKAVHLYEKNGFERTLVVRVKRHNKVVTAIQNRWNRFSERR